MDVLLRLLEWLSNNRELIGLIVGLILYIIRHGYVELGKKIFAILLAIAKGEYDSVTKEEVATVVLYFYEDLPDLLKKFISEQMWVDFWWARWLDFVDWIKEDAKNVRLLLT